MPTNPKKLGAVKDPIVEKLEELVRDGEKENSTMPRKVLLLIKDALMWASHLIK